jgi:YVTN family beta-propeller protein
MNDKSNTPHLDTLKTSPSIITASNGIFGTGSIYMAPTVTFTVPRVPPGHYTIYASNGNESASVPFTVLSMHNIHHGPKVGANIATGSGVTDVKVNENTNTIYSANYFSNSTSVIDGKTNQITATIPLSGNPEALAIDPISDKIYVGNVTGSYQAVTVIDGKTNKILDVIPAGYGSPTSMAVDYNTHRLYLANYVNNTIIIDTTTDKVIDTIPNNWPYYLAVNEKTDKAYVVDTWDAVVDVIDSKTDQVIDTISLGAPASPNLCWINFTCDTFGNQPFSIWINENTNTIYVDNGDGSLVAIDGNTDKVIYDIPNETSTIGFGDVNDNTNTVYNADQLTSYLYVVNGNTGKITDSIFVGTSPSFNQCLADPTCTDPLTIPYGVAVNDKTGIIYVADFGDNNGLGGSVIILDAKTHHKMGEIHMDKGLHHN